MSSYLYKLWDQGKLSSPPKFLQGNLHYECLMGSSAYGVSSDNSDTDLYGFAIPPKDWVFPHLAGFVPGFGTHPPKFDQFQQHHVKSDNGNEYDFSIYGIVKYLDLLMDCNPNIVDSIWVPANCITHCTAIGQMVRDQRKLFLHKGAWHRFRGYAYSQLHKIQNKQNATSERRKDLIERYGYDVKFAYHVVRLLDECQQILETGEIDLQRDRERLKAIRRGEWTEEQIRDFFSAKEKELEALYQSSLLRYEPDEQAIKQLLLNCLEHHYGSLSDCIAIPDRYKESLMKIGNIVREAGL